MKTLTRQDINLIHQKVVSAMNLIGEPYGLKLEVGTMTFTGTTLRFPVSGEVLAEGETKFTADLKKNSVLYFGKQVDPGTRMTLSGHAYVINGSKPGRSGTWIMITRVSDGRQFKASVSQVMRALTPQTPTKMTDEIKQEYIGLANALSPENLHCDGEISPARAEAKRREIMRRWRFLDGRLGRNVTEDEVWAWVTGERTVQVS